MEKHTPKLIWRDIVWRPSVAGVGALIATLPLLTWARDEFLSPVAAEKWKIPKLLPHWHWWLWVIIGLATLVLTILKASSEVINKYENEADCEIKKAQVELDKEISKRVRPDLTAKFEVIQPSTLDSFARTMLRLHNSSQSPAVGITVDDVRNGTIVLRFNAPANVRKGTGEWVECYVLENGPGEKNNVTALFDKSRPVGHHSPSMPLRITYSSLDMESWELRAYFWYDYSREEMCIGQQSISKT